MLLVEVRTRRGDFELNVRIEVSTPGTVALFGRSGCGKTTLVSAIAGLLRADHSRIVLDDEVLEDSARGVSLPVEQRRIGYVFQDSRLFPHLDAEGNLRYGERRARTQSSFVRFDQVVALLGLGSLLDRRPHELSGGERQRVALGRAVLSQPRLLLLDEPLAALDAARREELLPYFERLRDEFAIPIVYVSHQFEEVMRLATQVVVMDRGAVATQGDLEVVSRHPALRTIVGDEAIGSVVSGQIASFDSSSGLASVNVGAGAVRVHIDNATPGASVRVQLLARDIIIATQPVDGLSVRNSLEGTIVRIDSEDAETDLVEVNVGDAAIVLARVTRAASIALSLRVGLRVWVLVKSVSIRGHAFQLPAS